METETAEHTMPLPAKKRQLGVVRTRDPKGPTDESVVVLRAEAYDQLVEQSQDPPVPSTRLRKLAERYRRIRGR